MALKYIYNGKMLSNVDFSQEKKQLRFEEKDKDGNSEWKT